jgi:hypothetical protein
MRHLGGYLASPHAKIRADHQHELVRHPSSMTWH